ncbi:MAG: hypothetical protein KAI47_09065, partial [Deltaproteobacteria bacterium]|nr:hypothetical protein [Deltaproteobacteria bacterium]
MSDRPQRGRDDLLDDLVGMITATLATRSDDELAMLVEALESGHFTGLEALPVVNEAVMVQVDPAASKDAVREALHG